ncbi:aromatic acid exporter family protein [Bacillus sp. 31A1R]|uniref:Aromatic acid exporter family protein n=1 Tax=Robertmurraya mangrovi TaxID=3098077 RepID=A0ABU5IWS1_9BACI|nr:aromatic acid exporter family protein [Bacillus sp. 31A1R]MDZ5471581.1 aromatic acid exporter family protein [Bacillus sp. 31A1R]
MNLGPRVLKTGVSVTLALYICSFLQLEPAIFAGVAAIFTIQPSIYRTWKHVVDQLMANTLGAAIALFTINFIGNDPVIIGIVMIIVIIICLNLKLESAIALTLVTVLAIMSAPGDEDWLFTLNRFVIIMIGIGSAFLVNLTIFPPKYKKNYLEKSEETFQNMSLLIRTAISNELTESSYQKQLNKLKTDINKLEELFKTFDEEREKMSKLNPLDVREIVVFRHMLQSLQQGEVLLENIHEHYFQSNTNEEENRSFDSHLEYLIKCHEYFLLRYEGKVRKHADEYGASVLIESSRFLEKIMNENQNEEAKRLRLVVTASAIFEYAFQIQRLNRVIDQYLKTASK